MRDVPRCTLSIIFFVTTKLGAHFWKFRLDETFETLRIDRISKRILNRNLSLLNQIN